MNFGHDNALPALPPRTAEVESLHRRIDKYMELLKDRDDRIAELERCVRAPGGPEHYLDALLKENQKLTDELDNLQDDNLGLHAVNENLEAQLSQKGARDRTAEALFPRQPNGCWLALK